MEDKLINRMVPGDQESWHREWLRIARRNHRRGDEAKTFARDAREQRQNQIKMEKDAGR